MIVRDEIYLSRPQRGLGLTISLGGKLHREIFEFTRIKSGRYKGKEFESIVKPVIEKWSGFVGGYF